MHQVAGFQDTAFEEAARAHNARGQQADPAPLDHEIGLYCAEGMINNDEVSAPLFVYQGGADAVLDQAGPKAWKRAFPAAPLVLRAYPGEGHDVQYRHLDQILLDIAGYGDNILICKDNINSYGRVRGGRSGRGYGAGSSVLGRVNSVPGGSLSCRQQAGDGRRVSATTSGQGFEEAFEMSVIVLDGGMGVEIGKRYAPAKQGLWSASVLLDRPDIVMAVHQDFIRAGARMIITNTYSTIPSYLGKAGRAEEYQALTTLGGVAGAARGR